MPEVRKITSLGHPILRQRARAIANFTDPYLESLIEDLLLTAEKFHGVGIAAPQVAQSVRLFIVASRPTPRYPEAPVMTPTPLLNPRLLAHSEEVVKGWEGCLSVQGLRGLVPRYREVEVEYWNPQGEQKRQVFQDFIARIFQHELDHLDGKVFLERLESPADLYTEAHYQAFNP
jgi:peptide deformylase